MTKETSGDASVGQVETCEMPACLARSHFVSFPPTRALSVPRTKVNLPVVCVLHIPAFGRVASTTVEGLSHSSSCFSSESPHGKAGSHSQYFSVLRSSHALSLGVLVRFWQIRVRGTVPRWRSGDYSSGGWGRYSSEQRSYADGTSDLVGLYGGGRRGVITMLYDFPRLARSTLM